MNIKSLPYCHLILVFLSLLVLSMQIASSQTSTEDVRKGSEFLILQVDNTSLATNKANLVANVDSVHASHTWSTTNIVALNPYALYYKGQRLGSFTARIEQSEQGPFIDGIIHLSQGIDQRNYDSLGVSSFTAISENHHLKEMCDQPWGYSPQDFVCDFDCDGKSDTIRTRVVNSIGTINLIFGNGTAQLVDSVRRDNRLESIFVQDIFDLDKDGIPEILVTTNTYPTYGYIIYKYVSSHWARFYEAYGFGD